jgi:hypothetical protein
MFDPYGTMLRPSSSGTLAGMGGVQPRSEWSVGAEDDMAAILCGRFIFLSLLRTCGVDVGDAAIGDSSGEGVDTNMLERCSGGGRALQDTLTDTEGLDGPPGLPRAPRTASLVRTVMRRGSELRWRLRSGSGAQEEAGKWSSDRNFAVVVGSGAQECSGRRSEGSITLP